MDIRVFYIEMFDFLFGQLKLGYLRSLKRNTYKNYINRKLFSGGMFSIIALKFFLSIQDYNYQMLHLVRVVTFIKAR